MNYDRPVRPFPTLLHLVAAVIAPWVTSACGGCVAIYGYRDVTVDVRDAETGGAIPGARVDVRYLYMMTFNAPKPATGTTDAGGTVTIRAANFEGQEWAARADGYRADQASLFGDRGGTRTLSFRLYREPAPQVDVIVPNGYRGPLMIDRRPVPAREASDAGRRFTFPASPRGYVRFDATPLLTRMDPFDVGARYEDGTTIPKPSAGIGPDATALRSVNAAGTRTLFAVGTAADEAAVRATVEDVEGSTTRVTRLNHERFRALFDSAAATGLGQ